MEGAAHDYGEFCWRIKTSLSADGEIVAHADDARVMPDGTLILLRMRDGVPLVNLSISAGNWQAIYAVHPRDGVPFAIERWSGIAPAKPSAKAKTTA